MLFCWGGDFFVVEFLFKGTFLGRWGRGIVLGEFFPIHLEDFVGTLDLANVRRRVFTRNPEANSEFTPENGEDDAFLLGQARPIFRCELAVSFGEGIYIYF